MLTSTATLSAVDLYKKLEASFPVDFIYKVSLNKELSQDVLDVIKHLKQDLNPQDIVPNYPTSLSLVVQLPGGIAKAFHQDSQTYMGKFDEDSYRNFVEECLQFIVTTE